MALPMPASSRPIPRRKSCPLGIPTNPGLRGWAQRCGRALTKLKTRAVLGVDTALAQVQTILRTVKEHHLFAKGKQAKRQVLTRLLTEVGQLIVQTRRLVQGLGPRRDRVTQNALTTLQTMHEVANTSSRRSCSGSPPGW